MGGKDKSGGEGSGPGGAGPSTWNVEVFVQAIKEIVSTGILIVIIKHV